MINMNNLFFNKKRNKPKHQEGCDGSRLDITPTCTSATMCQLQCFPQHYQHQVCPQQPQVVQMPLSACQVHQCQTQQLVQSPQQQPYNYIVPSQYKNGSLESRLVDNTLAINNQIAQTANIIPTLPSYQSSQLQTMSSQQYSDSTYYSNQQLVTMMPEQQQQNHHQQQQQQHHHHFNQQESQYLGQQQIYQYQQQEHQQQQQQNQNDQRKFVEQQQLQQQFQNHHIDENIPENLSVQQQYQNQNVVDDLSTIDLSLEVLCQMHEGNMKDLAKLAEDLKNDFNNLADELDIIRKETPAYRVDEFKI